MEGGAAAEEADGFSGLEQRGFNAKDMRIAALRAGFFSGFMMRQQDLPERRGIKYIFKFTGIIPGVDQLDLVRSPPRCFEDPVVSALFGQDAVRPPQDIMIDQWVRREILHFEAGVPKIAVYILKGKTLLRVAFA